MDERKAANLFKALGDENRIRILCLLHGGEKCACKLLEALNISQPTLSHHMKILCDAGVVTGRREGKWMHYSLCAEAAGEAQSTLRALLTPHGEAEAPCSCCEE